MKIEGSFESCETQYYLEDNEERGTIEIELDISFSDDITFIITKSELSQFILDLQKIEKEL